MRQLTFEMVKEIKQQTNQNVVKVINKYNETAKETYEFAVRGGTRRKRDADEARVLAGFSLK